MRSPRPHRNDAGERPAAPPPAYAEQLLPAAAAAALYQTGTAGICRLGSCGIWGTSN